MMSRPFALTMLWAHKENATFAFTQSLKFTIHHSDYNIITNARRK